MRLLSVVMTVTSHEPGQPVISAFSDLVISTTGIEHHSPIERAKSPTPTTRKSPSATNIPLRQLNQV